MRSQVRWRADRSDQTLQLQGCTYFVLGGCEYFQRVNEEESSQGCERETMAHDLEKQDWEVKSVPCDRQ